MTHNVEMSGRYSVRSIAWLGAVIEEETDDEYEHVRKQR